MDQYLTTYKKDYPWPATRIKRKPTELDEYGACKCRDLPREIKPLTHCGDDYDWSRTGPMGRLLDPKLYPAKTGPHPETDVTRFDQPAVFMRKVKKKKKESGKVKKQNVVAIVTLLKRSFQLEEKYPNLYGILQTTPIDEVIRRVDQDRLKTTYQLDYSERGKLLILWKIIGIYSFFNKKRNKSDSDVKIENENSIAIFCIFVRRKFQKVYMFSKLTNYLLKPSHVIEKLIF